MPIITLQRRLRELGRIRIGARETFTNKKGEQKQRPAKLETFRLTSLNKSLIERAAELWGGTVEPWDGGEGEQFQVFTEAKDLPIALPPVEVLDQWMELWSGGGCQRRCDGVREVLKMRPCVCPEDPAERIEAAQRGQACKPTTRLRVILPDIPGVGMWRLESHGYYAAAELAGVSMLLAEATARGQALPARLRLEQRAHKTPDQPPKRFAVPCIDVEVPIGTVLEAVGGYVSLPGDNVTPLEPGRRATQRVPLPAGPDLPPVTPPLTVTSRDSVVDASQVRLLAIACRTAGLDDDARHALAALVTDGRTSSTKELNQAEHEQAFLITDLIKAEQVTLHPEGPEGDPILLKPDGTPVTLPLDVRATRRWLDSRESDPQ